MVADEKISKTLLLGQPAAEACQKLLDLALENGGKDNITVVVARYRLPASVTAKLKNDS
jgi:serine/threonine protein phosphatase PrpC